MCPFFKGFIWLQKEHPLLISECHGPWGNESLSLSHWWLLSSLSLTLYVRDIGSDPFTFSSAHQPPKITFPTSVIYTTWPGFLVL
jgi:hypothetical protein